MKTVGTAHHTVVGALMAAVGSALLIISAPALASPDATEVAPAMPPGNNGTVKIDGVAFDDVPNNQPHVGCTFQVDFYGFDEGDLNATVTFEDQAPTADAGLTVTSGQGNPSTVFIGEDPAGGGTDLDASETYVLAFTGEPHPQQGHHVKLTVNAEGSQGADTKHKVFWVTECVPPTTTTTEPTTTEPTTTEPTTTEPTTTEPTTSTVPTSVAPTTSSSPVESSPPPVESSTPPVESSTPPVESSTPPSSVAPSTAESPGAPGAPTDFEAGLPG